MSSHVFHEIYLHVNWHAKTTTTGERLKACTSRLKPTEDNKCSCSNPTSSSWWQTGKSLATESQRAWDWEIISPPLLN
jgi:hypothetical protein